MDKQKRYQWMMGIIIIFYIGYTLFLESTTRNDYKEGLKKCQEFGCRDGGVSCY